MSLLGQIVGSRSRAVLAVAVLLTFAVFASTTSAASATAGDRGPVVAAAAKRCGNAMTSNGRRALYVAAVRVKCKLAKRVARKARGRGFRAFGFRCRLRKDKGLPGKLYGCGRTRAGEGQGVGFLYAKA